MCKEKYYAFIEHVNNSLKYSGLAKLPPFLCIPKIKEGDNNIRLTYSASEILHEKNMFQEGFTYGKDVNLSQIVENEKSYWSVIVNEAIAVKFDVAQNSDRKPPQYYYVDEKKVPLYIKYFYNGVKSTWKNSLISFTDSLPFNFIVSIKPSFSLKEERQVILKQLVNATILYYDNKVKNEVNSIINDKNIPIKKAIDLITGYSGVEPEVNYSRCLTCGKITKKNQDVCPRRDTTVSIESWHCRNKINYRIKSKFGIKGDKLKNKREELYKELQSILRKYPLFGYDEFRDLHREDIFKDKRKKNNVI